MAEIIGFPAERASTERQRIRQLVADYMRDPAVRAEARARAEMARRADPEGSAALRRMAEAFMKGSR
jgi:hypothetical protein